ncbi:putative immunogenic protein NIP-3 [Aphelenchoides avenae]|nr:putative immunogenic protein NIP-3 [Aphelenchus avenae]
MFDGPGEKRVKIAGEDCMAKKWVVKTWKQTEDGEWVHAKTSSAKFDGSGWMRIIVEDNLMPWVNDRMGVLCAEGNLCG